MQSDLPDLPDLPGSEIRDHCIALIHESKVMTLGTENFNPDGQGSVWTAPVYYIFKDNGFYFFSNPKARHIREGEGQTAAASIFKDAPRFTQLKGIQMTGRIERCTRGKESISVALDYVGRFGIRVDPGNILTFFKNRFSAQLYRFSPIETYYMDNDRGIGNRTKLDL